ncbi:MAG: hypothetical protein JW917_03130 [Ignavibacteria bacterium]|nr:hypothetical protein [Ignavibacteria bacterium]
MKSLKIKILILLVLLITVVILLIFRQKENNYDYGDNISKSVKTKEEIKISLSNELDSVMFSFGIQKEWIKNTSAQNPSGWFSKEISLPNDVYAGAVVSDLIKHILQYSLIIESKEDFNPNHLVPVNLFAEIKDAGGKSEFIIANLDFIYNENLKRDAGKVCIILNDFENFEREKAEEIINNQKNLSFVMPNSFDLIDIQAIMINSECDYINCFEIGEANNYQADFRNQKDNMVNRSNNKKRMYKICNDYDKEKYLILLNPLKLNETQTEIINDLSKCRGNIFVDTVLIKIDLRNEGNIDESDFEKLIKEKTNYGLMKKAILLGINGGDYSALMNCISRMEKSGYKFYSFKEFVKRQMIE